MKIQGQRAPKKSGKRKVRNIRIERGANGYAVSHSVEPKRTRAPGGAMMIDHSEPEPKDAYFNGPTAHQDMLDHVGGLAQQMGGDEE